MIKFNRNARVADALATGEKFLNYSDSLPQLKDDEYLSDLTKKFRGEWKEEKEAIKRTKVSSELEARDAERDTKVANLKAYVTGLSVHPDKEKSENAKLFLPIFAKYTGIMSEPYDTQTAHMTALARDLSAEEIVAAAKKIDAQVMMDEMNASQAAFVESAGEYTKSIVHEKEKKNACDIKKSLLTTLNDKILPYLSTMAIAKGGEYKDLFDYIERDIEQSNSAMSERAKAEKAKK